MFQLREYQTEVLTSINQHIYSKDSKGVHPLIVAPTGSGKTPITCGIIQKYLDKYPSLNIIYLVHTKELIEQTYNSFCNFIPEYKDKAGIFSAGLKRKDFRKQVIFAGIQSIHKQWHKLDKIHLLIVDEAHRVNSEKKGQYRDFIDKLQLKNPKLVVIGLTATPFRIKGGRIVNDHMKDTLFKKVVHEIPIGMLIEKGYLTKPITKPIKNSINLKDVRTARGEYVQQDLEGVANVKTLIEKQTEEIIELGKDRHKKIIFCVSVDHANNVNEILNKNGVKSTVLHHKVPTKERDQIIKDFKSGKYDALCNMQVLTEGFDAPDIDMVVMLFATKSCSKYCQVVGRGLRIHDGKKDCLVLDYGQNINRFGPVDRLIPVSTPTNKKKDKGKAPVKECPECEEINAANARVCYCCGAEFPPPEAKLDEESDKNAKILMMDKLPLRKYAVRATDFYKHKAKAFKDDPTHPFTLRVDYRVQGAKEKPVRPGEEIMLPVKSEWVCIEHPAGSYSRKSAIKWFNKVLPGITVPETVSEAIKVLNENEILITHIHVDENGKYAQIKDFDVDYKRKFRLKVS